MKLSDIKEGDVVCLDDGLFCMTKGDKLVYQDKSGKLFFWCADGQHYLDGQIGLDGELIGISRSEKNSYLAFAAALSSSDLCLIADALSILDPIDGDSGGCDNEKASRCVEMEAIFRLASRVERSSS